MLKCSSSKGLGKFLGTWRAATLKIPKAAKLAQLRPQESGIYRWRPPLTAHQKGSAGGRGTRTACRISTKMMEAWVRGGARFEAIILCVAAGPGSSWWRSISSVAAPDEPTTKHGGRLAVLLLLLVANFVFQIALHTHTYICIYTYTAKY
jgi:hypothetical protein